MISTILGKIYETMSRNQAQDEKTLYRFLRSLWRLVPKFSFWKGEWVLGSISTYLWDFFKISQYSKIRSLNSFSKLWGNSFRMFFVLDIMYHFTCRESNLSRMRQRRETAVDKAKFLKTSLKRYAHSFVSVSL